MRTNFLSAVPFLIVSSLSFDAPAVAQERAPETAAAAEAAAEPAAPREVAVLRPKGVYADLPEMGFSPLDLLGGGAQPKPFFELLQVIDGLADAEQQDVLLDLSAGASFNPAQLRELERAITRVRGGGKRVTCYVENATSGSYQLAALCDKVLMADMGSLDLVSPSLQVMHLRDALDLLGIQVEVTRVGDFKGAVEPFMLPSMSEHLREHYEAMLASMNGDVVRRIADGRRLSESKVRELQARRLFSAEDALLAGLVDRLVPWAGAERALEAARGGEDLAFVDVGPKKKKQRRDLMAILGSMFRSGGDEEIEDPQIVVMHLSGQIVDGYGAVPGSMVSGPAAKQLDELAANDLVKGVVVRVNSPGGSATASEAIRQALARLAAKKPVVYSMGELAASGGYWITAIGEPIVAEVGTITGSIGVFGMALKPGPLMRRIGVRQEIVRLDDGPLLDAIDRPWSDAQKEQVQGLVDRIYDRFLGIVAESRGKTREEVDAIAGGRVWSGQQAVELGLVDRIGGVDDAVAMVRARAEVGDDVEVRHVPEPKSFADALFESMFEARISASADGAALRALLAECGHLGELVALVREALTGDGATRVYALMPPGLRVR